MAFPWQNSPTTSPAAEPNLPPNLAIEQSADPNFPDLYLFVDRTISPLLYGEIWKILPPLLASQNIKGLEQLPSTWVDQILLFRPQQGAELQGLLVGHFPRNLLRAIILNDKTWQVREIQDSDGSPIWIFDNHTIGIRLGMIGADVIAFQKDFPATIEPESARKLFDQHSLRSSSLVHKAAPSVAADSATNSSSNSQNAGFASELAMEGRHDRIFCLASLALPPTVPVAALHLRIETAPSGSSQALALQASLLPRSGNIVKSLKTGMKLALIGFSGIAGLDAGFINDILFTEKNGQLIISGLQLSEKGTANLLAELLTQALAVNSPKNEKETKQ